MIERSREGDVHVVTMRNGENRFDLDFLAELGTHLDAVEKASQGPGALVLTGEGKFFSNGIDLEFLMNAPPEQQAAFGAAMEGTVRRLVGLPLPTVAALNGHAFAGGALVALACDFRIQREERGWICISEVDVGVPLGGIMAKLVTGRLTPATAREAVLTGRRYAAQEARAAGLVDATAPGSELLGRATQLAAGLATKQRPIFGALKASLDAEILAGAPA